ncbi:phosphatidylinositol N-acetylglucosaminyltransferase subunit gpi1 [Ascosphaera pollenicola]|nr:phosphatidylinositol N-acetylglucosaminyltransferase subunit gpi1 [Ascosphaera pollenicola]
MQNMSLKPLTLALIDKSSKSSLGYSDSDDEGNAASKQSAKLVEKLKFHTVVKRVPSSKEQSLPAIINQINSASEIESLLQRNVSLIGMRPARNLSVSERVVESASSIWDSLIVFLHYLFFVWLYPTLAQGITALVLGQRMAAEVVLRILEWRARPDAAALKDLSATAQQVDIRLQQFCYWPIQYLTLRKRKDDWKSVTDSHPDYIRFYNSLWLVANDVIIGIALGSYIMDNAGWVANQINMILSVYTVEGLQRTISWLMGWPAGLKLNNELAVFLGDLFLWVIERWSVVVFYVAFASARMILIFFKATLDTCLAFLNHFPLFAAMLRVKDSKRLPGGIHFELEKGPRGPPDQDFESATTSYIRLKKRTISDSFGTSNEEAIGDCGGGGGGGGGCDGMGP